MSFFTKDYIFKNKLRFCLLLRQSLIVAHICLNFFFALHLNLIKDILGTGASGHKSRGIKYIGQDPI